MALRPDDLSDIERVLLGVLSVGLPPSKMAGDDTFRVDHVAAVTAALLQTGDRTAFLDGDGIAVSPAFRDRLRETIAALEAKGLLVKQEPGMPAAAGGFDPSLAIDTVNPDEHPIPLDRYLSQQCMETLLQDRTVYPYLMERYAKAGEVWRRLRDEGYG